MPLNELIDTFEHLKNQIATHGDNLKRSETRTRQVLIDPLLRVLGWDVTDPAVVELERGIPKLAGGTSKADYVLLAHPITLAVIEAKSLGRNLDDDATEQVLNYANRQGIDYMILSDGDVWRMHDVFTRGKLEDRMLMEFKISEQPAGTCAVKSLAMWNPNLASAGGPVPGQDPVFVVDDDDPDAEVDDNDGDDPPPPDPPPGIPLDKIKVEKDGSRKGRVNFPDRTTTTFKSWADLYFKIAKHLVDVGVLHSGLEPIGFTTGHRYAVSAHAIHGDGKAFTARRDIGGGLFLETNNSAALTLDYTRQLVKKCGLKPSDFTVQLDS